MTATLTTRETITEPGIYPDVPEQAYHADPCPDGSLSSSEARLLMRPSTPAHCRWAKDNPGGDSSEAQEFGSAAHWAILRAGPEPVVVEERDWRKKAAQEAKKAAHAEGRPAVLREQWDRTMEMANAIHSHPLAGALLNPDAGTMEATAVWDCPDTGIRCRARFDVLPHQRAGRLLLPDLKTAISAAIEDVEKAVINYGYHFQGDYYLDALRCLGLDDDPAFLLVIQEKRPPFLVNVVQLEIDALRLARTRNVEARHLFAHCTTTGEWPGYGPEPETAYMPHWYARREGIA